MGHYLLTMPATDGTPPSPAKGCGRTDMSLLSALFAAWWTLLLLRDTGPGNGRSARRSLHMQSYSHLRPAIKTHARMGHRCKPIAQRSMIFPWALAFRVVLASCNCADLGEERVITRAFLQSPPIATVKLSRDCRRCRRRSWARASSGHAILASCNR